MAFRFFIFCFFYVGFSFSQQQSNLAPSKKKLDKDVFNETSSSNSKKKNTKTSLEDKIDGRDYASKIDEKWLEFLYNNNLFDSIYESVTELDYNEVEYPELPTDTLIKRLNELNAKTPFNIAYNPSLESVIKTYLKNRRQSIQKLIALSSLYFPLFEQELDNQNIPLEIKYLSIVESALNPRAKSRVGATGLWQFMYATGKMYGLNVDSYVDERSDPVKSTKAAAKYLSDLYKTFGDWDLALAAYNSGPGNVTKAIRRSGGNKNYWNIRRNLPKETAGYVPAFLANMYIFEYAEQHGFKKYKAEHAYFETDTIRVKNKIHLNHVSEILGTPVEKLQYLNPTYKLDVIPHVKDANYVIRLPREVVGKFLSNEDSIYSYANTEIEKLEKPIQDSDSDNKIYYIVKSGDFIGKICNTYDVKINDIKKWNNLKSNVIHKGQKLTIYTKKPPTSKSDAKEVEDKIFYTVKSGDFISKICKTYGVEINDFKKWNNLKNDILHIGQRLIIYPKGQPVSAPETKESTDKIYYTVKSGDNLGKIANTYHAEISDLKQWNALADDNLNIGQQLTIYTKNTETSSASEEDKTVSLSSRLEASIYTVKRGDTLWSISQKFSGVTIQNIKEWNGITDNSIKAGMQLKIF